MNKELKVSRSPVLSIPVITHRLLGDERGPFGIPFEIEAMKTLGFEMPRIDQMNYSLRAAGGAFGIHVSNTGKYCFVLPGTIYHAWVIDLRDPQSETFGQKEEFVLNAGTAIHVPPGYGNTGQAQTDNACYFYALTGGVFDPKAERKVSMFNETLNLTWPREPTGLSQADIAAMSLAAYAEDRRKVLAAV